MAWRNGSFSRTLLNTARSPSIRRSATAFRRPSPPLLFATLRPSPTNLRTIRALGCAQSLMPLHSVVADAMLTSHISVLELAPKSNKKKMMIEEVKFVVDSLL